MSVAILAASCGQQRCCDLGHLNLGSDVRMLSGMTGKLPASQALLLFGASIAFVAQSPQLEKAPRIDQVVSRYQRYGYFNGAMLVADRGKVIYSKGVGEANMTSHAPNAPGTKFDIASITKQFTALLVLQQAAEGKVSLAAHVSDYLTWYRKDTGTRMTVEQLLRHTSGLPGDFDSPEFSATEAAARHYAPQEFAEKFCQPPLVSDPGAKWDYSNCGYNLLGLILERVAGIPFETLLHQRILEPLGMKDSGIDHNDLALRGGASGYLRHAGPRYSLGPYLDRAHGSSSGSMYSTVEDLYKWNQALSSDRFLSKELRDQVFTPGMHDWGYGWFVTKIPAGQPGAGSTMAEMRGDMPENYFAWILRYPERDSVIITLRNVYGSTEGLEQNIQAILFDAEPRWPSRNLKDLAAQVYLVPWRWMSAHPVWDLIILLFVVVVAFLVGHERRKHKEPIRS